MTQLALAYPVPSPGDRTRIGHHVFVWCWGLVGGWGWREHDLAAPDILPCPDCKRELGHDGPHTRVSPAPPNHSRRSDDR